MVFSIVPEKIILIPSIHINRLLRALFFKSAALQLLQKIEIKQILYLPSNSFYLWDNRGRFQMRPFFFNFQLSQDSSTAISFFFITTIGGRGRVQLFLPMIQGTVPGL